MEFYLFDIISTYQNYSKDVLSLSMTCQDLYHLRPVIFQISNNLKYKGKEESYYEPVLDKTLYITICLDEACNDDEAIIIIIPISILKSNMREVLDHEKRFPLELIHDRNLEGFNYFYWATFGCVEIFDDMIFFNKADIIFAASEDNYEFIEYLDNSGYGVFNQGYKLCYCLYRYEELIEKYRFSNFWTYIYLLGGDRIKTYIEDNIYIHYINRIQTETDFDIDLSFI